MAYDQELLRFNEKNHRYYFDGKPVPGVTTILNMVGKGDALTKWSANVAVEHFLSQMVGEIGEADLLRIATEAKAAPETAKNAAAGIGTVVHQWVEDFLKDRFPPLPDDPRARNSCVAAQAWLKEHQWQTLCIEKRIFSPTHWYAGTMDWKAYIDGTLAVPDWKTSKGHYSTQQYQTAAYVKAEEEETGEFIPDRWILRIDKETGEPDPRKFERDELEADFECFLAAKTLYHREAEIRRKK